MADDFLAELFSYLHVLERGLVGASRDPDRHHSGSRAGVRKHLKRALEGPLIRPLFAVPSAEDVRFRYFDIAEEQFRSRKRAQPDSRDLAAFERGLLPLNNEMAEPRRPFRRIGLSQDHRNVGDAAVADPGLRAIDYPMVALAL